jgi:REP element-mobilizing transposase RayT
MQEIQFPPDMTSMSRRTHLQRLTMVWTKHPVYFLTICVTGRRKILDRAPVAEILVAAWRAAPSIHGWVVGRYVIMPDHVHFFATPQPQAKSLGGLVGDWKKWTARQITGRGLAVAPVWQAEFFDHLLRSADSYAEKWGYVRENPVRAGLVSSAEAWSFAGECEDIQF